MKARLYLVLATLLCAAPLQAQLPVTVFVGIVKSVERGYVLMIVEPSSPALPVAINVEPYTLVGVHVDADFPDPHFSVGDRFKIRATSQSLEQIRRLLRCMCIPVKATSSVSNDLWFATKTVSVVAVCVSNPDRSPARIHGCDAAPTPTGFAEIVSDDLPLLHVDRRDIYLTSTAEIGITCSVFM
jgi:hypothetical protein